MPISMTINDQRIGIYKFFATKGLAMKIMDLMKNSATIEGTSRAQHLVSVKPKSSDLRTKSIQLVSNIPENGLSGLMGKAKTLRYLRKDALGKENNKAYTLWVIFSGEVQVLDKDGERKAFTVQESCAGIGAVAIVTDESRKACVVTLEKAVFAAISKPDFKNWLADYPGVKVTFYN
jgi:CRP-like cAMP-binding protein